MAPTNNYDYNFPYFPQPPPHYNPPSPPKVAPPHSSPSPPNVSPPHNFPPPHITPPSPKVPPPPRHPITPPPPAHPFHPPPPHHIPPPPHVIPPPAPTPGHHSTVIIVVFVSLGGLFFLAFLSVALCCFIKKKKKKTVQKTEILEFDEHTKVQEAIVPGPRGEKITVLNIEEDVHLVEEIKKNEKLTEGSHIKSARGAFARPSGQKTEPCQGIIYRVERSTRVVVEFGEDFLLQHHSTRKYDVSFSFNRVCLKRAHQAIEAASDPLFKSFLFPDCVSRKIFPISTHLHFCNPKLDVYQSSAVREILSFQGPPPYLVEGPLCLEKFSKQLSRTGLVVKEAVLQIYQTSSKLRILICAPINRTCDMLMQSLNNDIPESDMFRANAAFREIDGVPIDILSSCAYKGECFTCPSLQELRKFRVILSTFVSSFRLRNEGIAAGHFSHIFLVDASSATEPEAMVPLANLASEETAVIVTGAPRNQSGWVRSNIARENGLKRSYFERLRDSKPYQSLLPKFITQLVDPEKESVGDYSFASVSYD